MFLKEDIRELLEQKKIEYRWVEHEAVYTIDDMMKLGLESENDIAKNLFLRDAKGKNHYLIVVKSDKTVDLKSLGAFLGGVKLSFASEERLKNN